MFLLYEAPCSGADCAESGDFLTGENKNMIESMLGDENIEDITEKIKTAVGSALGSDSSSNDMVGDLTAITQNLASITEQLDGRLENMTYNLGQSLKNLNKLTGTMAGKDQELASMITNMDELTAKLANLDLNSAMTSTKEVLDNMNTSVDKLGSTLDGTKETVNSLNSVLSKLDGNEGSLGLMMNDASLYNNLNETNRELSLLLQDFRLNPKRYVNVSVFGKKAKQYTFPEDDPAQGESSQGGKEN